MGLKYFIFGAAGSFIVLVIVGGIFAIRAHANGEDVGGVVAVRLAAPPLLTAPPSNPFAALAPTAAIPTPATGPQRQVQFQPALAGDVDPASIGHMCPPGNEA